MHAGAGTVPPRCHPPPEGGTLRHVNNSLPGPHSEGSVYGNGSRQSDNWRSALAEPFVTVLAHGNGVNIFVFVSVPSLSPCLPPCLRCRRVCLRARAVSVSVSVPALSPCLPPCPHYLRVCLRARAVSVSVSVPSLSPCLPPCPRYLRLFSRAVAVSVLVVSRFSLCLS